MSSNQYNQLKSISLSGPLPVELEHVALLYMEQDDCKPWMREGLRRYIKASKANR